MSPHPTPDPRLEQRLTELFRDAVSGIEPADRLGEIRARTTRPARRRYGLLAIGGAVVASAAVVTAVAVVGTDVLSSDEPTGPAKQPTSSVSPEESASSAPDAPVATRAVAVYYLGDTPRGVRLYREFQSVETPDDGPGASLELLTSTPQDPDYRTLWPGGSLVEATVGDTAITVELSDAGLAERPPGMTEQEAQASVQQVVYTLQAYAQLRLPLEFTVAGEPVDRVLGVPARGRVPAAAADSILSLVNLTAPEQGQAVSGTLRVEGVASSFEGTVLWTLTDSSGESVAENFFTAEGFSPNRLHPFRGEIDVSSLPPGDYVLEVRTDDPSGGQEGFGPFTDTRSVVVE